jgi:hypothetical protein
MSRTLLIASLFTGGCAMNEPVSSLDELPRLSPNGTSLNGASAAGLNPNGTSPAGLALNGVSANGVSSAGAPLTIAASGAPLAGSRIVGSIWTGHLSSGSSVALRIDNAMQGTGANTDMWSYRLSVSVDGAWRPLCLDATGHSSFADSVRGSWNFAQGVSGGGSYTAGTADFTIACQGSAIAKCLELGYKPWTGHAGELAACTRALRGDYCGDGTPYTIDGTVANIYDVSGIQPDDMAWDAEAEWTAAGARCVSKKKETRFNQAGKLKPSCFPNTLKSDKSCGAAFAGAVVIITELSP